MHPGSKTKLTLLKCGKEYRGCGVCMGDTPYRVWRMRGYVYGGHSSYHVCYWDNVKGLRAKSVMSFQLAIVKLKDHP